MLKFNVQDGGLEGVETEVAADMGVIIFGLHAVVAELARAVSVVGVRSDDHATVTEAAQVFSRKEGKATEVAK